MLAGIDLVASDAIYHGQYEFNYFTKKYISTKKRTESEYAPGLRTANAMKSNFEKLCKWLDKQTEFFIVNELHAKMCSFAEKDLNVYSLKWMKKQLEQYHQNFIFLTDEPRSSNVVYFTTMASTILSEQWYKDRKDNFNDEKARIINAAANLIKSKIICIRCETYVYPSKTDNELGAEFLPPTLKLLMKVLMGQGLIQASLSQYILKVMKPNSVTPPFLFRLGVEIDHAIASKTLLTETSKLGYAISFNEVEQYKQPIVMDENHKLDHIKDEFA